jgi:flagella basal body P-ring formation protein FlgA
MTLTAMALAIAVQTAACLPVSGDLILAGDLAKAVPAFAALPADAAVGHAPAPGATRIFRAADLQREARRLGLSLGEVGEVCFQWPLSVPTQERFREALEKALDLPGARIEILETSRQATPPGPLVFSRSSLTPPPAGEVSPTVWRGYVQYGKNRRFLVWARVRITASVNRVVTTAPIRAGERIRPDQVRLESLQGFPFGDRSVPNLDLVVGQVLRRPLSAGFAIPRHLLERPLEVERADLVKVRVRNGAAVILAEGLAEAGGRQGDTIAVRNPKSGATFRAKITGPKQVTLTLSGK